MSVITRRPALIALLAIVITLVAKVAAAGREVALAHFYGSGAEVDAFFVANLIPGLLWASFIATIPLVFVPAYLRIAADDTAAAGNFAAEAVQGYLIVGAVVGLAAAVAAPWLVDLSAPALDARTRELAILMTRIMACGFPMTGYVLTQNALQQARGTVFPPLVVPLVNNVVVIAGIAIASAMGSLMVAVICAVGIWFVQAPIQRFFNRSAYEAPRLRWVVKRQTLAVMGRMSFPIMLGTFLDQINLFVGMRLANRLAPGAIADLNYGSRLSLFLATVFSLLVAYLLFAKLATAAAQGDDGTTARLLTTGVLTISLATIPLTVVAFVMRGDVVELVYSHGVMSVENLRQTALAFGYLAPGIVLIAVREMFNRVFFSWQRNWLPLGASIAALSYLALQIAAMLVWRPQLVELTMMLGILVLTAAAGIGYLALTSAVPHFVALGVFWRLVAGTVIFTGAYAGVVMLGAVPLRSRLRSLEWS